jgi:hypothetical protein
LEREKTFRGTIVKRFALGAVSCRISAAGLEDVFTRSEKRLDLTSGVAL